MQIYSCLVKICMHKRILVTGANGQVGKSLFRLHRVYSDAKFFFTDRNTLDITDRNAIEAFIDQKNIDMIINCAAYTAVDRAEEESEKAFAVNRDAVKHLAKVVKKYGAGLIHISTDYVFDGTAHTPLRETDHTNPQGVYAVSKKAGEQAILEISPQNTAIIRTSWVYDRESDNFVNTMLRLGKERASLNVVSDQVGTPTYAPDLAQAILEMIKKSDVVHKGVEIYHYSNEGVCSWYDFAHAIFEISEVTCQVLPIPTEAYPTPAKRPAYSVMDKRKIKKDYGFEIPHWRDSLRTCLSSD